MSRAKGYNSQLAMAYEQAYGQTPGTPAGYNMPFNQAKIGITQNLIESATIRGRRDKQQPVIGNVDVSGSLVVPLDQVGTGYWLRSMFGNPVTTGASAPYTHVFKVTDSQPSLVLEQQYPDIPAYEKYNGCKINKFSFTYGGDAELVANIDIIGARRTIGSAPFAANLTEVPLVRFNNFQGVVEEGGAQLATVTEATLNVDFGLDNNTYTIGGGGYRTDLPEGVLQVSGTIKAFFSDTVLLNKAINNTKTSLKFKFVNGNHNLQFYMEEVVFEQTSPGIESDKGITINLPFKAFYANGGSGSIIVATLVNNQMSYSAI
ncbi:phage tail tube protein [Anaerospora sp.]|uniref:phage tail tube protein n=1 Tax=Anaerospora sp. TaxID=1960278 RepID=UPI00289CDF76|nr:phage tail tube protein [Anaerospora sp.]